MQLIENWLKGSRNFITGKILYDKYGADNSLKKLLLQGETPTAKKKLIAALQAIADAGKIPAAEVKADVLSTMPAGSDDVLESIRNEWLPRYQEMNYKRHRLDEYGDRNDKEAIANCKVLCFEILELEQQVMACWAKRDHYLDHGQLPEVKVEKLEIPTDPVKLATLINTLKRNIRRNKQLTQQDKENPKYPALVKKYEQQLQQVYDSQDKKN